MEVVTTMDGDRLYVPYYLEVHLHPYMKNIYSRGGEMTRILSIPSRDPDGEANQEFLSLEEPRVMRQPRCDQRKKY